MTTPASVFGDALVGDERLPAVFEPRAFDHADVERLARRAERLVAVEAMLCEEPADEDDDPRLARLEAKLDLLLELVGALAAHAAAPEVLLRWSSQGIELPVAAPLEPGTTGVVRLVLMPGLPLAPELPGVVAHCRPDGAGWIAGIRFVPAGEALESALARRVFRAHRRAVAQARRSR